MLDSLGQQIFPGDIVLFADGNARYGGLYLRAGHVCSMTEKRVKLETARLDGPKAQVKTINKTPKKLTVCSDRRIVARLLELLKESA